MIFKLIKIGWDYYVQILQFRIRKQTAETNLKIIAEYKAKHPDWKPNEEKQAVFEQTEDNEDNEKNEGNDDNKTETKKEENDEETAKDTEDELKLIEEPELRICGCIAGGWGTKNQIYLYCLMIMQFLGVTLALVVLGGLEASGGISIGNCEYKSGDYDSACYSVGRCANPGYVSGGFDVSSSSSSGDTTIDRPVYAIINKNVDLEGPQIVAILATLIGYIAYVPWIREKINQIIIKKGWREGETEADEIGDQEMWSGLF